MDIIVTLPGAKRVDARVGAFTIHTDQPPERGGQGSAPEPFDLFLASIGTCAGLYVAGFCQTRGIPTEGIRIVERTESDPKSGRLVRVTLDVQVPPGFPVQYRDAVARAAALCKVKKTLAAPPELEVATSVMVSAGADAA
jgi:ribosomal protein S12 methylthiotransferase accessory factor